MSLAGQVALVTGASRGLGRGIALQLGAAGAIVYVTGRKPSGNQGGGGLPTLESAANEITARGGHGIAVHVDHSDMEQVRQLFSRIELEQSGRLDILVNNAYGAVQALFESTGNRHKKFFELEPEFWDVVNNVGLRNHYFCSVYAARLMAPRHSGLIVNVSSAGGLTYLFNVAYGVGKAGLDRMAGDYAEELKGDGVTVVSLWPGAVRTETVEKVFSTKKRKQTQMGQMFAEGETPEYAGHAVVALAMDPARHKKTGKVLVTADLGDEYGFVDVDGRRPPNLRQATSYLDRAGLAQLAAFLPENAKLPGWAITALTSKL